MAEMERFYLMVENGGFGGLKWVEMLEKGKKRKEKEQVRKFPYPNLNPTLQGEIK